MEKFVWQPGDGADSKSLMRLRSHFRLPENFMGEGWFMAEKRRFFDELNGDLDALSVRKLQEPLQEIASGTSAFGPRDEWKQWYHYLLGQLIPRAHENFVSSLLESIITGFFAMYPNGIYRIPYPEFQNDVLLTLGRSMMDPLCWDGQEIIVGKFLHRSNKNPNKVWCWWDASGDLSASMYFCLKYLPSSLVQVWFESVLKIESPHWRAQVLVWLVGSYEILNARHLWPSEFIINAYPSVQWEWSHCISAELAAADDSGATIVTSFITESSCDKVLAVVHAYFTEDVFLDWLESIAKVPYLDSELATIPSMFELLYVNQKS